MPIAASGTHLRDFWRRALRGPLVVLIVLAPVAAKAQPRPAPPRGPAPPVAPEMPDAPHIEETLVVTVAGGLTAEGAAKRAVATSYTAKQAEENAAGASARVEQADLGYVPELTLTGSYTRLSPLTPPLSGGGATRAVITDAPAGTVNPPTVASTPTRFPVVFDYYLLQASLRVPISDYFLKVKPAHTSATQSEEGFRYDVVAARAVVSAAAKQGYFEWLRARGAVAVAEQTLAAAQAHSADAKTKFGAGAVAGADVLRAEAAVAAAELLVERAKNASTTFEWNVRTLIHATEDERIEPGESLDGALSPVNEELKVLLTEAYAKRAEMKSADKHAEAQRKLAQAARAGRWPALQGTADLIYSNPNTRKFPITAEFFPSWAVGVQLTWSPRSFLVAGPAATEEETKASAIEAEREATRERILREVVAAYSAVRTADAAVGTTTRQLDSEREAYRVSRQLYTAGRTTGSALLDAQNALAQARFDNLNARTDARVARVQLEHAVGRDTRQQTP